MTFSVCGAIVIINRHLNNKHAQITDSIVKARAATKHKITLQRSEQVRLDEILIRLYENHGDKLEKITA